MKKFISILMLMSLCALALTGCVAATTVDEDSIDRPSVVVTCGETELAATPEEEAVEASTASDNTESEPVDNNIYNSVAADSAITLSGKHASGIASVCYRVNGGDPVVVKADSVEITAAADLEKLELYVMNGNGIASHWATYFFTVD